MLRLIARKGRDGFYRGAVAAAIVAEIRKDGGLLTLTDLANALKRLKRYREAEALYAQVVNGDPDDETLDEVVEELAELREMWSQGMPALPRSCVTDPNAACAQQQDPIP